MNKKNIFKGKWTVTYDSSQRCFQDVLTMLLESRQPVCGKIDLAGKLQKIEETALLTPVRMNDKRWETINLTTAALYLGSAIREAGFGVVTDKLVLPAMTPAPDLLSSDAIGFTLFEDMMDVFKDVPGVLRQQHGYQGLLAAGGPMVTLNPLQSVYHLPDINLFIRGEAELILPGILKALNHNDIDGLLKYQGFLLHWQGNLIISDFGVINRPAELKGFRFNLDFLEREHLEHGLELNISRGCRRGCIFCSAVQGKCFRPLPEASLEQLLAGVSKKLNSLEAPARTMPHARSLNINDDDILQDPGYAGRVFALIKKAGFRLWGIQTSLDSFFKPGAGPDHNVVQSNVLDLVSDRRLYMDGNPLVWLGTDAFLKERGRKLAKLIPDEEGLKALIEAFEIRKVRNYHYWISSDHHSDWPEFVREFILIHSLLRSYSYFGLIGHSPFLVPYSATPLYRLLNRSGVKSAEIRSRIKYKKVLEAQRQEFAFPLVERVETEFNHLNRLLKNEKEPGGKGFFDHLKQKDYTEAAMTVYGFLKQERMDAESLNRLELASRLKQTEAELEEFISSIL